MSQGGWVRGDGSMPVAGRDFLPIDALFDVEPKGAVLRACVPLLPPIRFPGLSRCGVSDGVAPQRAVARIGQPIRGPDAGQSRQPQRVQPGGFFRPLFGRSKRGHSDRTYRQDCTRTVRLSSHIEEGGRLPAQLFRPSAGGRHLARDRPSAVANAIGRIDDRAEVSSTRDSD
jgi:hypothetical protein